MSGVQYNLIILFKLYRIVKHWNQFFQSKSQNIKHRWLNIEYWVSDTSKAILSNSRSDSHPSDAKFLCHFHFHLVSEQFCQIV